jgi:hypothetical protein
MAEAQRRSDAAAAGARKAAEAEWQAKLDAAMSERDAKLAEFEKAEQARKDQELTEVERERKAREAAAAEAAAQAAEAQQLRAELDGTRKRAVIGTLIAASATRVPARYHADVYAACLSGEQTPEAVETAMREAKAAWEADIAAYSPKPEPTAATAPPRSVGTPAAPPAQPTGHPQSEAERREAIAKLTEAYMNGDMEAGNKLDVLIGTGR